MSLVGRDSSGRIRYCRAMSERVPSRATLLAVIERQAAEIMRLSAHVLRLQTQIEDLEAERSRLVSEGTGRPPTWVKPNSPARSSEKKARKKRTTNFARKRSDQPTQQIVHGVESCPRCACTLVGGWVKRHREVIEIVLPRVEGRDHVLLESVCTQCG